MPDQPRAQDTSDDGDRLRDQQLGRPASGIDKVIQMLRMRNPEYGEALPSQRLDRSDKAAEINAGRPDNAGHPQGTDKSRVPENIRQILDVAFPLKKPQVGDKLPDPERVAIDRRKFTEYELAPEHPKNADPKAGGNKS